MIKNEHQFDFDFSRVKKNIMPTFSPFNILKKGLNYLVKITSGISVVSLFFLINNISYDKQIEFVKTTNFSTVFLLFFSLFWAFSIIKNNFSILKPNKEIEKESNFIFDFFSPLYLVFIISFFIPNNNGTSLFSDYVVFIINCLKPIINITYS